MTRFDHTSAKTARARQLRRDATRPEQKLWLRLRGAQVLRHSFRRQHPIGPYILDFYCPSAKIAVELDGDQHAAPEARAYDARRAQFLRTKGISVLRFANHDLKENLDGVLEGIAQALSGISE
jgi:very-short-patch-repair endonuclease